MRGRDEERDDYGHYHRSSSNESNGVSYYRSSGSRASSRGPQTPNNPKSPFDAERRRRSTPLANSAPSSWSKRPAPAHRRKSDAGSRSDSEVPHFLPLFFMPRPLTQVFPQSLGPPSSFNRSTSGRVRAPSNPTSPSTSSNDLNNSFSPIGSPPYSGGPTFSRPHSRAQSQPINNFGYDEHGYSSPDDNNHTLNASHSNPGGTFMDSISSLPVPRANGNGDDTDSDHEDSLLSLVIDRSMVSLEPLNRLDALQRANADLNRKCMEAERTLKAVRPSLSLVPPLPFLTHPPLSLPS